MSENDSTYLLKDNNFARELFKSGTSHGPRRMKDKLPPAVTLSGDKIVKVFGTNKEDITEKFYQGPGTMCSMEAVNVKDRPAAAGDARFKLPSLVNKLAEMNPRHSGGKATTKEPFVMVGSGQQQETFRSQKLNRGTKIGKMNTSGADQHSKGKRRSMDTTLWKRNSLNVEDEGGPNINSLCLNLPEKFDLGTDGVMFTGNEHGFGNVGQRRAVKVPPELKLKNVMFVAGRTTSELIRPVEHSPRQSSYVLRKQYNEKLGKDLLSKKRHEGNKRSNDPNRVRKRYNLDSDTFYSSGSEYESDSSEVNNALSLSMKREKLMRFASTDVLLGSGNFEDAESESDVETVLKGDEVFTRRTKNKMKKKRMRQFERYLTMLSDPENSDTEEQIQISALSDKELRAIRHKVNGRKVRKKREAIRRFRKGGLAVLASIRFRKGLISKHEPHKVKSKPRKKKERPLGKRVRFDPKVTTSTPGAESTLSEEMIIKMSPKERFIVEFGWMLNDLGVEVPKVRFADDVDSTELTGPEALAPQTAGATASSNVLTVPKVNKTVRASRESQNLLVSPDKRSFEWPASGGCRDRRHSLPSLEKPPFLLFKVKADSVAKKKGRKKNIKKVKPRGVNNNESDPLGEKNKGGCSHNHGDAETKRAGSRARVNDESVFEEVRIELHDLRRSVSTGDIPHDAEEVDLRDVVKDVDFPAKEVKLQIVERRRRRERKKRLAKMQRAVEAITRKRKEEQEAARTERRMMEAEESEDEQSLDKNMKVYLRPKDSPFVTAGVAWNQRVKPRVESPSLEEIDKQLPGLSRLFLEMRDCKYIRWRQTDQKIIERLREVEYMYI